MDDKWITVLMKTEYPVLSAVLVYRFRFLFSILQYSAHSVALSLMLIYLKPSYTEYKYFTLSRQNEKLI